MKKAKKHPSQEEQAGFIYGKHVVDLAMEKAPACIEAIYLADNFSNAKLLAKIQRHQYKVEPLQTSTIGSMAREDNHQGIIAKLNTKQLLKSYGEFIQSYSPDSKSVILVLSEIQDPQNVGAMIRSAAAFGVDAIFLARNRQAPVTGTVAKVSAGMLFAVPIVSVANVNEAVRNLKEKNFSIYGLAGEGEDSVYEVGITAPTALVVGNEAHGLREKTRELCTKLINIPIAPYCESLNAGSAVAVAMAVLQSPNQG